MNAIERLFSKWFYLTLMGFTASNFFQIAYISWQEKRATEAHYQKMRAYDREIEQDKKAHHEKIKAILIEDETIHSSRGEKAPMEQENEGMRKELEGKYPSLKGGFWKD